ncbi:fimbrillin family protein [Prevotella melaninogenica]|uniref:fimbrillin family protein n=1 Tax=Prevotella melaninogenica TaxID=28132 RepID=UPI003C77538C
MKLKTIFGIILGVVAVGLTSCSSDLTNGENTAVNPNETAKRTLSLSTDNAKTRSEVNLTTGNKWETGDQFFSYNLDLSDQATESPNAILTAKSSGASTLLQGTVACKNGDRLNIFYPGTYVTGYAQGTFPISMQKSLTGNKTQDGTVENLKNFDYSFGTGSVTVNGNSASGNVDMEKLYAILKVDFTFNGTKLTNIKKLVLSNVITGGDFKVQTGQMNNTKIGSIEVKPANPAELLYVAIFPTNGFKPKFEVYTTDNKAYTYTVTASDWETKTAKVYPITVAVKEFTPNPPYVEVNNVKWGKYNLQYTPGSNADGWTGGYHLAANPWDYYYSDGRLPVLSTGSAAETDGIKSDHFRWGDISKAHNYGYDAKMHYDETVGDIKGQITTPNEFGDLPYYASQQQWRLPSPEDFEDLMKNTTEYVGYYNDGTKKIYGALFVPDGVAHGWVVNKNNSKHKRSNQTGTIPENQLREFTKEFINKGVFFPAAGSYVDYSNGAPIMYTAGRQGLYWTSKSESETNAYSFTFYLTSGSFNLPTVGNGNAGNRPRKFEMYSIRPIYIGQ